MNHITEYFELENNQVGDIMHLNKHRSINNIKEISS